MSHYLYVLWGFLGPDQDLDHLTEGMTGTGCTTRTGGTMTDGTMKEGVTNRLIGVIGHPTGEGVHPHHITGMLKYIILYTIT